MIYRQKIKKSSKSIKTTLKTKIKMKNRIRGFIFCSLWFLSIIAGFFFLVCPIIPLVVLSPKRYRKWSDVIFGMWEPFPVAMMEVCFGIRVVLSGDKINPFEGSLFIMNHRTRVDWNFLWLGLFHCCQPNAHNMKYILKAPIMHIPGPGWVMQTCSFIFIHRNWDKDKKLLDKMLDYLNESDDLYQILLFPEGTDLSEQNIKKSHKYADEHNLERYYKVLHPRTTGFAFLANKMKLGGQLKAIYDVTVAYPKTMPQNEVDLLRGKFPEEVHFHVKRHSSSNIPFQDDQLKNWLTNIWQEKEQKLQKFYKTGCFEDTAELIQKNSSQEINYGKISMKNGTIKYKYSALSGLNQDLNSNTRDIPVDDSEPEISISPTISSNPLVLTDSKIYAQNHMNCDSIYRSKNYRPSHLLYLVLAFWLTLIVVTMYVLFNSFYAQIWVMTHCFLFIALSFVSSGFHQVAASIYFYRFEKRLCVIKKTE